MAELIGAPDPGIALRTFEAALIETGYRILERCVLLDKDDEPWATRYMVGRPGSGRTAFAVLNDDDQDDPAIGWRLASGCVRDLSDV
jgi:hypothetical protein